MTNILIDNTALPTTIDFLSDLQSRRNIRKTGTDNVRQVELNGGKIIEPTAFEPDPLTHRDEYYYNAITNTLYRRIITRKATGIESAHWKKISD